MTIKNRTIRQVLASILIIVFMLNASHFESARAVSPQLSEQPSAQNEISCLRPASYEMKIHCANLEANLLAVTVRIEMHAQYNLQGHNYTKVHPSHATIMAGRYLVTHNHFKFALTETAARGEEGYFAISLRSADGAPILDQASLDAFTIVHADAQTLVLEFLTPQGNGLFSALGLPSANFADWQIANLHPGTELAQIDWNGTRAHVDWVQIDNMQLYDAVPQLQVNNFARFGCSGGGIFWQGQHIGNNWARNVEENPANDEITRRYSIVALNSSGVLELAQ
jgi:hypothetical protein